MEAVVHPGGRVVWQDQTARCALGVGAVRVEKVERDGATPAGLLPLRRIYYRADRLMPPKCAVPIEPIGINDAWCDDPTHRDYNRFIRRPHEARHEQLWRRDGAYDLIGVLGWNDAPVVRGRGSAIFLHVARDDYAPTEGCVALAMPDLARLLADGMTLLRILSA